MLCLIGIPRHSRRSPCRKQKLGRFGNVGLPGQFHAKCGQIPNQPPSTPSSVMYESALSLFREACGLTSPLTLVCQDSRRADESATESQFSDPFVLIGRDIQLDLVLDDPRISRRHAFLQAIEGQLHCLDLDSRTKTYWDDEITPRARGCLHPGQTLKVGPFGIRSTLDRHPLANSSLAPLSPSPGVRPESVAPPLSEVALELPIRSNRCGVPLAARKFTGTDRTIEPL